MCVHLFCAFFCNFSQIWDFLWLLLWVSCARRAASNALGERAQAQRSHHRKRRKGRELLAITSSASRSFLSQWWEIKTQTCKEGLELRKWEGLCSKVVKSIWSRKSKPPSSRRSISPTWDNLRCPQSLFSTQWAEIGIWKNNHRISVVKQERPSESRHSWQEDEEIVLCVFSFFFCILC